MRLLHKPFCSFIALISLASSAALAQRPAALIREKVDENQLTMLRGNTPPAAIAKNDAGPVNASMAMTGLVLVLQRSPEMQAAFDAFVESQYEPNSPNFHQWLTPDQIGEKFGPATADIQKVTNWLGSHGLTVDEVSKDRMTIRFSGTARQVEAAFHTQLHNLSVNGKPHFANMTDPQIPMALDPVVLGPKALHNFIPKPLHRTMSRPVTSAVANSPSVPSTNASGVGLRPEMGFSCGSGCQLEDVTPSDFAAIYNVTPLWSSGIDGTGQTIAIAGRSDVKATDVTKFRTTFGLSGGSYVQINNGADPGNCTSTASNALCTLDDQIENALDVEWAGALAPKATVKLIVTQQTNSNDAIFDSASYAVNNVLTVGAKILNVSYGNCELFLGTSGNASYNGLWQTAASAGIAVFVASGDSGSPACDQGYDSVSGTPYGAQFGLAVSGIASTPYNTAVGGTDLNWGNTASPYWNSTNSSTTGASAIGYMPERPWNNTCTNPLALSYFQNWASKVGATQPTDAETACNFVVQWWQPIKQNYGTDLSSFVDTVGAGGGASNCTTNSSTGTTIGTCSASGYSKPTWQTGVSGIPTDGKRDIPDISFFAGNGLLGSAYFMCVTDWGPCLSGPTATSEPTDSSGNTVNLIGGTSAASPAMAGIMALINQKAGSTQGNPNKQLYTLAAAQNYGNCKTDTVTNSSSCYFNDVDSGTIAMPCQSGAQDCSVTHSGDAWGVLSGFAAGSGYDAATGLGSMNVANVVNGWSGSIGTTASTVTVTPASSTIISNQSLSVTVTVGGASGVPTGAVALTGGGYSSGLTLSSGSATFNIPANSLSAGTVTLTATYSGDPTYASTSGTAQVTVTAAPVPTVTVVPGATSINSGQSLSVQVNLAGANGTPTGNVTLSGSGYTSSATAVANGAATINIPANSLIGGTVTLTASYAGDSTYGSATGTANVTVTQSTFALTATAPAAVNRGSSAASTITWTTSNNFSTTVKLAVCTLNSGAPANSAADTPKCTVSTTSFDTTGSGTATVTTFAATKAALQAPHIGGWAEAGGGAVLAFLMFLGIPARRRGWRAMVGMVVILFALGGLAACGGGGGGTSSGGGGGTSDPGTASGTYTFTVTAVGNDAAQTTANTTFSVKVN